MAAAFIFEEESFVGHFHGETSSTLKMSLHCELVSLDRHNKISQTRYLNNRNVFPHTSEGWKFENKMRASLISPEALLLGL